MMLYDKEWIHRKCLNEVRYGEERRFVFYVRINEIDLMKKNHNKISKILEQRKRDAKDYFTEMSDKYGFVFDDIKFTGLKETMWRPFEKMGCFFLEKISPINPKYPFLWKGTYDLPVPVQEVPNLDGSGSSGGGS